MTLLAQSAIAAALANGRIICHPAPKRIEGAQIDITLGEWWWEFEFHGHRMLDIRTDDPTRYFVSRGGKLDKPIIIQPRGFILAHTAEYIGTAIDSGLVPNLHTRSTFARWGLSVCTANAGQGDEGYVTRWALEITNPHAVAVVLWPGMRVGSISFTQTIGEAEGYTGRYNAVDWTPQAMLPRRSNF